MQMSRGQARSADLQSWRFPLALKYKIKYFVEGGKNHFESI